jgi:hypothetical protein
MRFFGIKTAMWHCSIKRYSCIFTRLPNPVKKNIKEIIPANNAEIPFFNQNPHLFLSPPPQIADENLLRSTQNMI